MPSIKEVKNRIGSVKSTQQLTKAMKMVAAAKLKKAQDRVLQLRPYSKKLNEIKSIDADILTVSNPGCFIQLQGGGRVLKLNLEVMYITDLLYNSYLKGE